LYLKGWEDVAHESGESVLTTDSSAADKTQWIAGAFAKEEGLSRKPFQGDKVELLGEDILILLETWYKHADFLPCTSETRQAFHFLMLINGLVGARPGSLFDFVYEDFEVFLQRDPEDPAVTYLIATIHLHRNKQLESAVYEKTRSVFVHLPAAKRRALS
jgi:hypothetical protein